MKFLTSLTLLAVIFTSCSIKEVYEPKKIQGEWSHTQSDAFYLKDVGTKVARLSNGQTLTQTTTLRLKYPKEERLHDVSEKWLISSQNSGKLFLHSLEKPSKTVEFTLEKAVASASVSHDTLALLLVDNSIVIYDIPTKKRKYYESGSEVLAVDVRVSAPLFLNDLVVFGTLDGKVIIVNAKTKTKLNSVVVSYADVFNNVIYLEFAQNKLVAATSYGILSLSSQEIRKEYEIRDIIFDEKNFYVTTKEGEIISLNTKLEENYRVKLPFAHFLGLISNKEKLYLLEKEGYMIVFDKKTQEYTVHEVEVQKGAVFVSNKMFYIEDGKILIE